jgi:hypothetical protein
MFCLHRKHLVSWVFLNRVFFFHGEELLAHRPTLSWRTTPSRLSAAAYSTYSQLPSILEAVPPFAIWGHALPWWQGPTIPCSLSLPSYWPHVNLPKYDSFSGNVQGEWIRSACSVTPHSFNSGNWLTADLTALKAPSRILHPLVKETSHLWEKPHETRYSRLKNEHLRSKAREFKDRISAMRL